MSDPVTVPFSVISALGGLVMNDPGVVHGTRPDQLRPWHPCSDEVPHPDSQLVLPASAPALDLLLRRALGTTNRPFHRKRDHGRWGIGTVIFTPDEDDDAPDALYIHVPALGEGVEWVDCPKCGGSGRLPPKNATHIGGGLYVHPLGAVGEDCLNCGGSGDVRSPVHMDYDKAFAACLIRVAEVAAQEK